MPGKGVALVTDAGKRFQISRLARLVDISCQVKV